MTGDISTRSLEIITACTTNYHPWDTTPLICVIAVTLTSYRDVHIISINVLLLMFVPLCLMFVVCPMLCNAWTLVSVENFIGASLFTRWRHSQYNQHKLKTQTSRRSSIYIFLLHCVDNWTVLVKKTYFRPYVVIIVDVLCRINTTFYLAVPSIDTWKLLVNRDFFIPFAFDAPVRGLPVGISPPRSARKN